MFKYSFLFVFTTMIYTQIDTVVTIDASNYSNWTYFSLSQASIVDIQNPENSLDWDIALQRKHIRTNSGLAGIGNGGAYVDSSITWINQWNSIDSVSNNIVWSVDTLLNDFYDPVTHYFVQDVKNSALNSWGWFDESYTLNVTHYVLFVKSANGEDIFKFWPFSYYNQNNQGGHISFRYQTALVQDSSCDTIDGDVNFDGIVNIVDVVQIVNYVINSSIINNCELSIIDLNLDGFVNVVDIIAIVNIIISQSF